jgi:hypothetical protein
VSEPRHPLWKALASFGDDAGRRVLPSIDDERLLTDEQVAAIADASSARYWTDGRCLFGLHYPESAHEPLTARQALDRFGLDALEEAHEKAIWEP